MKLFSTPFSNAKKLALLTILSLPIAASAQMLLAQDFNSGTTLSNYMGTGANQFDSIKVSQPNSSNSVYVSSNRLTLQRYGGSAIISKSTNLSATAPTFLRIKFRLNVPFNSIPTTIPQTQATVYVGSAFNSGPSTTSPNTEVRHSSFGIGFGSNTKYYLRSSTFINTVDSLTGENEINWFINNSGASVNYKDPVGGNATLADDQYDLWVGGTRVFAGIVATTPTSDINNFKVLFNGSVGGGISFDDFEITTGVNALPISLSSFKASMNGSANQLTWSTASEVNNKGFDVQRQSQNGVWETLGFVNATNRAATYNFEDKKPFVKSFYRLRQVDLDGKESFSSIVSVSQKSKGGISIAPNPTSDKVVVNLNQNVLANSTVTAVLYDLAGKKVLTQNAAVGTFELDLSNVPKGTYILTVQSGDVIYNEKIIRQ